jgi:predicted enzyme related to lactoylglutathione lyase
MSNVFQQHGAFSWCELMTTDVDGAKRFYSELFGWQFEEVSPAGVPYNIAKVGGAGIGGIMAIPPKAEGMPPHWGSYVTVDDIDVVVKTAQELGAEICIPPMDIPGVGRFCVFRDPQGASIAAITYTGAGDCEQSQA